MAKFKQIPQNFLFRKLLHFWKNMVHNYNDDCRDDDFFDVVTTSSTSCATASTTTARWSWSRSPTRRRRLRR